MSTSFDAGTLGAAGVVHVRGSVGALLYGWELFGGYDFLRIGGTKLQAHGRCAMVVLAIFV